MAVQKELSKLIWNQISLRRSHKLWPAPKAQILVFVTKQEP